jgi:glutamyl-tRNA reductase
MPAEGPRPPVHPVVVGVNHRSCPPTLRELLATEEREVAGVQARLRAAGLDQFMWLSTCDRVEVVAAASDPGRVEGAVAALFAERASLAAGRIEEHLYVLDGEEAVRHVFAVASSLDSQVVGEPQVLGQVKAAHRQSLEGGLTGAELEALMQAAFAAAKRVRTETAIVERPVSIAAAAVQTARDLHGNLKRCSLLLAGLGDMGELMVEALREAGVERVTVAARGQARAEAAGRRHGGHWMLLDDLDQALEAADVVVAASGLGRYLLTPGPVAAALRRRRRKPMLLIDTAVPGDVDPAVGALADAFVYDLADLERVALEGRAGREAAAAAAWAIVEDAVRVFSRVRAERAAVPAVSALRRHFEETRARILAEHPGVDAAEATRLLVNRLLHGPSEALRGLAALGDPSGSDAGRLLERLFRLDRVAAHPDPEPAREEKSEGS